MIWLREIARLGAIILWILVAWASCDMMSQEAKNWRVEVQP